LVPPADLFDPQRTAIVVVKLVQFANPSTGFGSVGQSGEAGEFPQWDRSAVQEEDRFGPFASLCGGFVFAVGDASGRLSEGRFATLRA
jgi:hypothetical protein